MKDLMSKGPYPLALRANWVAKPLKANQSKFYKFHLVQFRKYKFHLIPYLMFSGSTYSGNLWEDLEERAKTNGLKFPYDLLRAKVHSGVMYSPNITSEFKTRWGDHQLTVV